MRSLKLGSQRVNFSTPCTGNLQKSHPLSIFLYCHVSSPLRRSIFNSEASLTEDGKTPIVVLQVMTFGENIIVEYLRKKDIVKY